MKYSQSQSAEDVAIHNMEPEALVKAREELRNDERELIEALFF